MARGQKKLDVVDHTSESTQTFLPQNYKYFENHIYSFYRVLCLCNICSLAEYSMIPKVWGLFKPKKGVRCSLPRCTFHKHTQNRNKILLHSGIAFHEIFGSLYNGNIKMKAWRVSSYHICSDTIKIFTGSKPYSGKLNPICSAIVSPQVAAPAHAHSHPVKPHACTFVQTSKTVMAVSHFT